MSVNVKTGGTQTEEQVMVPASGEKQCRFCRSHLRHTFVDLGMSPLANNYLRPDQLAKMEPFYPLHAYVCATCFLVQLEEFESPDQIFSDYAYFSSYSDTFLEHSKSYTESTASRFSLDAQSLVVEIASNDGYLLQYFVEKGIPVLGVEPAKNVAETAVARRVPTLVKFFGEATAVELASQGRQADLLIGNNVLAHVPDLNDFIKGMTCLLKPRGVITLEFPHLMRLMKEKLFDTIYHEHFSYFSFLTVVGIFAEHGLTIFDVEEIPTHGGSLRIYARHSGDDTKPVDDRVENLLAKERSFDLTNLQAYLSFGEAVEETKRNLLAFLIRAKREGKSIAAYGAPAKGNTLLNYCGIRSDFLDYTVDRSPHKQGLFLPGSHIPIHHPDKVGESKPDYLLLLPWNLKEEIMEQMSHIRTWGGKFVVPIPEVKVYE